MRPPDKLEKRARELAIAAGLNPDDRVGEGRGMPHRALATEANRASSMRRSPARFQHLTGFFPPGGMHVVMLFGPTRLSVLFKPPISALFKPPDQVGLA